MKVTDVTFFARKKIKRPDKGTEELTAFSGSTPIITIASTEQDMVDMIRGQSVDRLSRLVGEVKAVWRGDLDDPLLESLYGVGH